MRILLIAMVFLFCISCSKTDKKPQYTDKDEIAEASLKTDIPALLKKCDYNAGVSYESTVTVSGSESKVLYWVKGEKIKSSIKGGGKETVMITDGQYITTYVSDEKAGVKMKLASDTNETGFFDPTQIDDTTIEEIGHDMVQGKDCVVATAKHSFDGTANMLWIQSETGFVVKIKTSTDNGDEVTIENNNIVFADIPDSVFSVPSEIIIQDL
jgi:outer membrane lipoprotein-sorting protein